MSEQKDLTKFSIIIPAECYSRLVNYLSKMPYSQIFEALRDLELNAYEVDNESVPARAPFVPNFPDPETVQENPAVS